MKKKILSLAVATGLVGAASAQAAMHINDEGLGEALVYPFYSAANGNDTYVHLVNTTNYAKAVKVRFIEAMNSQEVLDFNLYLSPEDEWAGVITANPNGDGAIIRTADNSCTVPQLGTERNINPAILSQVGITAADVDGVTHPSGLKDQPFVNFKYASDDDDLGRTQDSIDGIERTTEGYIEIIEMGQLDPAGAPVGGTPWNYAASVTHNEDGMPNNCGAVQDAWAPQPEGDWQDDNSFQILDWGIDPEATGAKVAGGLYGYGVVINVNDGTSYGYDAVAIDSFELEGELAGELHFAPGNEQPSLSNAEAEATIFDGATATNYIYGSGQDAVSALFMSSRIMNDYVADVGRNAETDWVVTMPTKRFYVDGSWLDNPGGADAPFYQNWNPNTSRACEGVAWDVLDREEAFVPDATIGAGFSPAPPTVDQSLFQLCTEVSIIAFGEESALHGSDRITYGFTNHYNEGWASLVFAADAFLPRRTLESINQPEHFLGLPVTGFAVQKVQNGTLEGGVLANYGAAVEHKSERLLSESD